MPGTRLLTAALLVCSAGAFSPALLARRQAPQNHFSKPPRAATAVRMDLESLGMTPMMIPFIGPWLHNTLGDAGDVLNFVLPLVLVSQLGKILDLGKRSARASHILVKPEAYGKLQELKQEIEAGTLAFEDAAREFSTCPSGKKGGSLGEFKAGKMVPEFDKAVFNENVPLGQLQMVRSQFGWHLVKVESRS